MPSVGLAWSRCKYSPLAACLPKTVSWLIEHDPCATCGAQDCDMADRGRGHRRPLRNRQHSRLGWPGSRRLDEPRNPHPADSSAQSLWSDCVRNKCLAMGFRYAAVLCSSGAIRRGLNGCRYAFAAPAAVSGARFEHTIVDISACHCVSSFRSWQQLDAAGIDSCKARSTSRSACPVFRQHSSVLAWLQQPSSACCSTQAAKVQWLHSCGLWSNV